MCKETEVKMIDIELDLDKDTVDKLLEYARDNILKDEKALINWAANDMLSQIVETDGECLKEKETP